MGDSLIVKKFLLNEFRNFTIDGVAINSKDFEFLVDTFIDLVNYNSQNDALTGLARKLMGALTKFANTSINSKQLSLALEELATGFEGFLKKIAILKFSNSEPRILYGDFQYNGFLKTTLGNLMLGKVDKVNNKDATVAPLIHPIITFSYTRNSFRDHTYLNVKNLRNEVHIAKERSLTESINLFKSVITAYLFAVEENICLINNIINNQFLYLRKIKHEFKKISTKVIELDSEKRYNLKDELPQIEALEWKDNEDDIYEPESLEEELNNNEKSKDFFEKKSVFELPKVHDRFWLIGEPGAGKSFSLKAITLQFAQQILISGKFQTPYPIYLIANQYELNKSFRELIYRNIQLNEQQFSEFAQKNEILILIDGFNEISKTQRTNAFKEIENLIETYQKLKLIISARKSGFKELFNYPVFELLPLTDQMIKDYVIKYVYPLEKALKVYALIEQSGNLIIDFARNPLMLQMLIQVIIKYEKSPENRGKLFYYFTNWFFSRNQTQAVIDLLLTEKVLAEIAFRMRSNGLLSIEKRELLEFIKEELMLWNYTSDISLVYDQFVDSFMEIDSENKVVFFHELMLEYFSALKLKEIFGSSEKLDSLFFTKIEWSEPIVMLTGIIENATKLIDNIYKTNLILAARCISSGAQVSPDLIQDIISYATSAILQKTKGRKSAITCLLELGTPDALRTIIKLPVKLELSLTSAINKCQRPEISVLKLLRFGLTGKHRVRQCLSVFYKKPINSSFLNSEEVVQAQTILFESPDLLEYRDLELLENIGVSKGAEECIKKGISFIILTKKVNTSIWRKAIQIAGKQKYIEESVDIIMKRLDDIEIIDGTVCYSIFITAGEIPNISKRKDVAVKAIRYCLNNKYYGLAIKFIRKFGLEKDIREEEIKYAFTNMAREGKIKSIIDLHEIYSSFSIIKYITKSIEFLIKNHKISPIFENMDSLNTISIEFNNNADFYLKDLIKGFNNSKFSIEKKRKLINLLNLTTKFSMYGIVAKLNREKNFGFLNDLFSGEELFFRPFKNTNLKTGLFVKYEFTKKASAKKARSEVRILMEDSVDIK